MKATWDSANGAGGPDTAAILDGIGSPADLRRLPRGRLGAVAAAVRQGILETVSRTGGHLGASLGVVELATALHYVFETPRDRVLWDVGHQGYPHKFLTGRSRAFSGLGLQGGIGKFLRRSESLYDVFGAGHAGTSVSAAVGIAEAIRRRGGDERVVAVIGDGALTAGMAYEGLNSAGFLQLSNLVVVLNDNAMSISPNVGALAATLAGGRSRAAARRLRVAARRVLESVPGADADRLEPLRRAEEALKDSLACAPFFEALGFAYVGPVDGHDLTALVSALERVRDRRGGNEPVLVHCRTRKGCGYGPAERDPVRYHGVGPFAVGSGRAEAAKAPAPSWTSVFSDALVELARRDRRIVGITAAMADGTGLTRFREAHPDRFYDVGIAEQHAVTMAAGMATEGLKPVCAIYSTFLQRGYDQLVHDVGVQNLDVTFAIDRAGLVGAAGATHQGLYDLAYLQSVPNMIVMAPRDATELRRMLRTAIEHRGPAAIRFPRGAAPGLPAEGDIEPLEVGRADLLRDGTDVALLAVGNAVSTALEAARRLSGRGIAAAVLDARFVQPLDARRIAALASRVEAVVTVEEHVEANGFGAAVVGLLARHGMSLPSRVLALPNRAIEHGDPNAQRSEFGLDAEGVARVASELLRGTRAARFSA